MLNFSKSTGSENLYYFIGDKTGNKIKNTKCFKNFEKAKHYFNVYKQTHCETCYLLKYIKTITTELTRVDF